MLLTECLFKSLCHNNIARQWVARILWLDNQVGGRAGHNDNDEWNPQTKMTNGTRKTRGADRPSRGRPRRRARPTWRGQLEPSRLVPYVCCRQLGGLGVGGRLFALAGLPQQTKSSIIWCVCGVCVCVVGVCVCFSVCVCLCLCVYIFH